MINCAIALNGNSTSSIKDFNDPEDTHYPKFELSASPELKTLDPYTDSTKMFTNLNSEKCGGFTTCYPLPAGCSGTYTGKAKIEDTTLAL